MSRFTCKCGKILTDTLSPDPNCYHMISDEFLTNKSEFGELLASELKKNPGVMESKEDLEEFFVDYIVEHSTQVYKCSECGEQFNIERKA